MSEKKSKHVLVVDDDMFTAELTALALETAGYEPTLAEGGLDAMEKMSGPECFAAVVSDMNMPIMNGAELFAELGKAGFSVPFVLLTGQDAQALKDAHPGMSGVLQKDESFQQALPRLLDDLLGQD